MRRAFRADVPLKQRGEWETYLTENCIEVEALSATITTSEREIDRIVYTLFDLTAEEINLLEASLAGQY